MSLLGIADPLTATGAIEIHLTVEEQRKIVEADTKEPCFRIWLSPEEYKAAADLVDWTMYKLMDGRYAAWRRCSDLQRLWSSTNSDERALARAVSERKLDDSVI